MITQKRLKELFYYSNGDLYRAIDKHIGKKGDKMKGCLTGKGYKIGKGYLSARVDGTLYPLHRLIFLYHHGYMPEQIDHINNKHNDNRIENLRPCTNAENALNKPIYSNNTSGHKGVSFRNDIKKWTACVRMNKKSYHLGCFKEKEEAVKAVESKREELHKDFCNHG